jgi:pentapeptide MXKDX repeat protein
MIASKMLRFAIAGLGATLLLTGPLNAAPKADAMKADPMAHDAMKADPMAHDAMAKGDAMKADKMAKPAKKAKKPDAMATDAMAAPKK